MRPQSDQPVKQPGWPWPHSGPARQQPGRPRQRSSVRPWQRSPVRPLLAASARPWAGALLAGCAILVAALGALFAHQTTADRFDRAVDSPVIAWFDGRPRLATWLAYPGTLIPAVLLSTAIVVACLLTGRRNGAVLAATAVPVATGLSEAVIKPLVHRTYLGQIVYPSGHTATIFALAATVTVLLLAPPPTALPPAAGARAPRPAAARALRILISTAAGALAVVVVVAVIGLRFHYFTDTVAGAAVGIGTVCGLAFILDHPAVRRWPGIAQRSRTPHRSGAT
jgi:membrane-associated phospholipid phosphatase